MAKFRAALAALALGALSGTLVLATEPATAGSTWSGIRGEVFGARPIEDAAGLVTIKAPYRPDDVRAVPVSIEARLPAGRSIRAITLVVDENPSPVAATFKVGGERSRFGVATKVRLNQESLVRAIVEDDTGRLVMAVAHVKFAGGQAACSAPPTGDPAEIAASMGKMKLATVPAATPTSSAEPRVRLDVRHPNHTGMALDQMTLLYIPLKMVTALDVRHGDKVVLAMTGSITLAENPSIEFDLPAGGVDKVEVSMTDSDGAAWTRTLEVGPQS